MSVLEFKPKFDIRNYKKYIIIGIIGAILLTLLLFYCFNSTFRNFITIYIFRKGVSQDKLTTISLNEEESSYCYAYDKYIVVLSKNTLSTYNSSGNVVSENEVNISSPIFSSNNRFLAIAENNNNTIYLISGSNIIWQGTVDGKISKVNINNNGYVSVILTGTSYKSIVVSFDPKGKELFKTYLSSTTAIDTDISNDNKYLSIAEVDYSGAIAKSMIKTISIEKAKSDPSNSVIHTYTNEDNNLITAINYGTKNILGCIYNDSIHSLNIADGQDSKIVNFNNQYNFADINLKNSGMYSENKSFGFSSNTNVNIQNLQSNNISTYSIKGSIKSIYCYNERIAINNGSEIHFIGLNGWLIKKYTSLTEINSIILGDSIAGIVYKDKVEIVQF